MNLGKLNKTVILIDTDYLNQKIKENIEFYKDLYPDKELNTINLYQLIYKFIVNARVESDERNIDVLFAYRLSDSLLYSTNPGNVWNFINAENLNIDIAFLNPFEGNSEFDNIENPAQYAVAFGCALRGLVEA